MAVFGLAALGGIIAFAAFGLRDPNAGSARGSVVIWGSQDDITIRAVLDTAVLENPRLSYTYVQVPEEDLDARLTEALATDSGPDVVIATQDAIFRHKGKFLELPYEQYPASWFRETFSRVTELYLGIDGLYGLPLYIDPVVLIYNRDILAQEGYAGPADNWVQMVSQIKRLTRSDNASNITRSGLAFGTANNIHNTKAVYSALAIQAGDVFTQLTEFGTLQPRFGEPYGQIIKPAESALRFYTQFGNVDNTLYSWNSAFARSDIAFSAGQVAYIVDYASAVEEITARNPQIDLAIAELPTANGTRTTYARVYGAFITRNTKNYEGATALLNEVIRPDLNLSLAQRFSLAPARIDALSVVVNDPTREVIRRSATYARSWLDRAPQTTELIISDMIRQVQGGQTTAGEALLTAQSRFESAIK